MTEHDLLAPPADGELEEAFLSSVARDRLHLIILPTEQCNFRCTYCYETFEIGRMSTETVTAVKRLIDRRLVDLSVLSIEWFGGEPLVARDIVEEISEHIVDGIANTEREINYFAGMTTNGFTLNVPVLRRLTDLGIRRYQISLDGPQRFHDRTRILANQAGTFERIWRRLVAIRDSDIDCTILLRVHLTPENIESMEAFVTELGTVFLTDERFALLLTPVEHLGGPRDSEFDVLSDRTAKAWVQKLRAAAQVGAASGRCDRLPGGPEGIDVCYAAKPNSLVIRATGRLAKCTVALASPANDIGRILPDGSVEVHQDKLAPWFRGWQLRSAPAVACPLEALEIGKNGGGPSSRSDLVPLGSLRTATRQFRSLSQAGVEPG